MWFRGETINQKKWSDKQKLKESMRLHKELHDNYILISELVLIAIERSLQLVIENPYTQPHYLTTYWCIKPRLIDKDRTQNGDYYKKPTQFFFINYEPRQNLVFEALDYVEPRVIERTHKSKTGIDVQVARSMIHPQYASRFIRQYLIDEVKK